MPWEPRPRPAIRAGGSMAPWKSGSATAASKASLNDGMSEKAEATARHIDQSMAELEQQLSRGTRLLQHDQSAPRRPLHSTCLLEFQTAAPPFIAKQSISGHKGRMDCFRLRSLSYGRRIVACAPRNDTERVWTRLGIIAARSTRAFPIVCPKKRAQETPGALGTRSPCAMVVSTR